MVKKHGPLLAAIGVALVWSGFAAAQPYRPGEFLKLNLSQAVLSPRPLGPATSFTPGPLDVTVDRGSKPAQADAELVVDPKAVLAATVHAGNAPTAHAESKPASRAVVRTAAAPRVAHARTARPARHAPHRLVALHGRNPMEAQARDTRIQVWPCRSGGICNWKR
ncbi:hypothetical protein [Bradyrhizobium sp.]|uniref:hypothetical protein n=1 Tax=Bradyrhizobium sp. TaxID=376 RepID=UPI002602F5FC|nr:hypothetical protein [Bradyrhizobium sp.]